MSEASAAPHSILQTVKTRVAFSATAVDDDVDEAAAAAAAACEAATEL